MNLYTDKSIVGYPRLPYPFGQKVSMLPSNLLGPSMGFDCQKYKFQEDKIVSRIAWRNREHRAGMMPA